MIDITFEVLPDKCRKEGETMIVLVRANTVDACAAHDQLNADECKSAAVEYATLHGVSVPRMEDFPLIYPVDKADEAISNPSQSLAAFAAEYRVAPRLI